MMDVKKGLCAMAFALLSCALPALPAARAPLFGPAEAQAIRSAGPAFPGGADLPPMRSYLDFYGLDFPKAAHRWGFVASGAGRIFVQGFEPEKSHGTLLFLHGYMSHSGCQAPLVEAALSRGWAVYLADLPGHGLSDGAPFDIGDFEEYGEAAMDFAEAVARVARCPGRMVAAGHSTGCSAWLAGMHDRGDAFDGVVFGAPLVRSASWGWSRLGLFLGGAIIKDLPRGRHDWPENQPYPFASDPLAPKRFPVHWVEALFDWNRRNPSYGRIGPSLVVIQGDADTAVDWRYNLRFLGERFDSMETVRLKGARHEVFRSLGEARVLIESAFDECLGKRLGDEGGSEG